MFIAAGFSVFHKPAQADVLHTIAILDFEDCRDQENVRIHQSRGVKVVGLAYDADSLEIDPDDFATLSGILTHNLSAEVFMQSLRVICAGERIFPRNLAQRPRPLTPDTKTRDGDRLSPREKEIISHIVEGRSNKVIARHLGITEATVKVHIKHVLRKIRIDNRTQAAIWALANLPELDTTHRGFV
jgi:DNA-binding NarL/FixJ family response regulator